MNGRFASVVLFVAAASGCHHGSSASHPGANRPFSFRPGGVVPIGDARTASTVALARIDGRRVAFVSDTDGAQIRRIDLDQRSELPPLSFDAYPGPLLVLPDGRLLVLAPQEGKLVAIGGLERGGTDRAFLTTPSEPVGLALSPDRETAYVTSGWGRALTAFTLHDLERSFELPLAREPRAIVMSDDGARAFVSHAVGSQLTIVDVASRPPVVKLVPLRGEDHRAVEDETSEPDVPSVGRSVKARERQARRIKEGSPTCQSFTLAKSAAVPNRLFVPEVLVDPGESEKKSRGYGSGTGSSEIPVVAVVDQATGVPVPVSMKRFDEPPVHGGCILPRAAVIDDRTRSLLVACQGIDALVAYDATNAAPARAEVRRWSVGVGPTGIALDPERREAIVWSQFDRTLSIIALDQPQTTPVVRIASPTHDMAYTSFSLGRVLFHSTGDARISEDGRACASCHPDGRDDGLVWSTPEGPRRSIMLAGRLSDTAPFSWQGNAATIQKHLASTFTRLGGHGLEPSELDALVGYIKSIPGRSPEPHETDPRAERGAKIFLSAKAGCASCHSGPSLTDGALHNVGSGRAFNTPSLLGVGATGPWFHDGRYSTLGELLRKSDGKMGRTKHLTPEALEDLEAYLRTL